jgi:LysM repeat protein
MLYGHYRACPANHYPYTVQPGDTLNTIAYRLETSVARIMAANPGVDPYNLQIGQMLCIPACPPNHTPRIVQPGDTLYAIAQAYGVTVESILEANPGVDPRSLRVGQRLCIPAACSGGAAAGAETIRAMQRDIDMLKQESEVQKTHESNYGSSKATTRAVQVTESAIRFEAAPVTFTGDYRGRFTVGKSYSYYADAAMGGQRGLSVKDNFGVWHSFGYHVPIG